MSVLTYNRAIYLHATGALNLATADLRMALLNENSTAGSEPAAATLSAFSDLSEIEATNYARKALANETVTQDDVNNQVVIDADNPTWTALGGAANDTITAALVYVHTGADSANVPLYYIELNSALPTNGSDVSLQVNPDGLAIMRNKAA